MQAGQDVGEGNPCMWLVGLQTGMAAMEDSAEVPRKTKSRSTHDPAILLLVFT